MALSQTTYTTIVPCPNTGCEQTNFSSECTSNFGLTLGSLNLSFYLTRSHFGNTIEVIVECKQLF